MAPFFSGDNMSFLNRYPAVNVPSDPLARQGQSVNHLENRFRQLMDPEAEANYRALVFARYKEAARRANWRISVGPDMELAPLVLNQTTIINNNTATFPGVPVSLSVDVPRQQLRYFFQDGAFIRSMTVQVTATRLLANGQPEPGFFEDVNPADYIYGQWRRAGAGDVFQDQLMPLSEIAGDAGLPGFFSMVPAVQPSGTLLLDLTIVPPAQPNQQAPPFVSRIGLVSVSLHCERVVNA
jgi:hypothetical protein